MSVALRIVGQGIAGSLLAWCALRRGISVEIWETPNRPCASKVAAGIVNPITGQRWVKSWRVDELMPLALDLYRELEADLGQPLVQRYRLRRLFRDAADRKLATRKIATGELSPFVVSHDEDGLWIEPAFRVDLAVVVSALRKRWQDDGQLKIRAPDAELPEFAGLTVWCRGAAELESDRFRFASLSLAQGEILSIASPKIVRDVILNSGHWLLPIASGHARVGATYRPEAIGAESVHVGRSLPPLIPTAEAKELLTKSAKGWLDRDVEVLGQEIGWRVTTRDKHPVLGLHPSDARHGIFNGLGSKGALLAPFLAEHWCDHMEAGTNVDPAVDVRRFA